MSQETPASSGRVQALQDWLTGRADTRLGRLALQWFRQNLTSEDVQRVHEGIQLVATEGLTLLWPDLDRLADAEDTDVAHHAREALERLCEEMDQRRK